VPAQESDWPVALDPVTSLSRFFVAIVLVLGSRGLENENENENENGEYVTEFANRST